MPPNKNSKRQEADLEQQLKSLLPGMGKSNTKVSFRLAKNVLNHWANRN